MSELHKKRLKASEFKPGMKVRWLKGGNFDAEAVLVCEVKNQGTSKAAIRYFQPDGKCVWNHAPGGRFVLVHLPNASGDARRPDAPLA